jgi:hypothetical protein
MRLSRPKDAKGAKAHDLCTASWRIYDAICDLGYADCSVAHRTEIIRARKLAWARYQKFSRIWEKYLDE